MAVRKESVELSLTGDFTTKMALAAAQTAALRTELRNVDGKHTADELGQIEKAIDRNERALRSGASDLDSYSGRLGLATDAVLTFGTALVPLGASTIPLVTSGLAGLAAAGGGLGVTILAVHGLADGLKALDAYKLAPTAENLAKLRAEAEKLGPAGLEFDQFISGLEPKLRALQDDARQGLLPGAQEGISDLLTRLPQVQGIVTNLATGMGDLAREGGEALASDRFSEFFDYVESDAKPILEDFGKTAGHVVETVANLFVGFAPLTRSFSDGLERDAAALAKWSQNLDRSQSFQSFLSYVEESGPKAINLLESLAHTFAAVVEAAAPIGQVTLPILTDLSNIIGALASSPLGTPLLGLAAGLTAVARAQKLLQGSGTFTLFGAGVGASAKSQLADIKALPAAYGEVGAAQAELAAAQSKYEAEAVRCSGILQAQNRSLAAGYDFLGQEGSASLARVQDALGRVELASRDVQVATERVSAAEERRSKLFGSSAATAGKAAAATAGLVLATSGLADKVGLSHTASLGLLGTLGGPWGTALGAAAGFTLDLADADKQAASSVRDLNSALSAAGPDFAARGNAIDAYRKKASDLRTEVNQPLLGKGFFDPKIWDDTYRRITMQAPAYQQMSDAADKASAANLRLQAAVSSIAVALGSPDRIALRADDLKSVTTAADQLKPSLDAIGVSFDDLANMNPTQIRKVVAELQQYNSHANSVEGRNLALASAFQQLDNKMLSTSQSASVVSDALSALLSPKLNLSQATDAWTASLRSLDKDLAKSNKTLQGNSDAALQNRNAIRQRVSAMEDVLNAEAQAGASSSKLSTTLGRQRGALIAAGQAAGIGRGQMSKYLDTLGLTPKLVQTLVRANTDGAVNSLDDVRRAIMEIPTKRDIYVNVHTNHTGGSILQQEGMATGGQLRGPGTTTSDSIPIWASDREYVIRAAAVDRYGVDLFHRLNAMTFADGGLVANTYARSGGGFGSSSAGQLQGAFYDGTFYQANVQAASGLKALRKELDEFKSRLEKANTALSKEKDTLDGLKATRDQLAQSAESPFQHDPFGNGLAGFNTQISADNNDAASMLAVMQDLVRHGLDPHGALFQALATSGDLNTAQQLDQLTSQQLLSEQNQYNQSLSTVGAYGSYVGNSVQGDAIAAATKQYDKLKDSVGEFTADVKYLGQVVARHEAALKKHPHEVKQAVHDGAQSGTQKGAADGARFKDRTVSLDHHTRRKR